MNYQNLVGHGDAIQLNYEYNLKDVIPFLMTCFESLNLIIKTCIFINPHGDELEDDSNMFGVGTSFEQSFQPLVIKKLYLFKRLSIYLIVHEKILVWWCNHLNVAFMAKQILGILRSQIENKQMFSLATILTFL